MWTDSEVLSQELPTYDDEIFMEDESSPYFYTPGFYLGDKYDMVTDQNGGLHFVVNAGLYLCKDDADGCEDNDGDGLADSLYFNSGVLGSGMYHFYNPDPMEENSNSWKVTLLMEMSDAYASDWELNDYLKMPYEPWYVFYPQISPSYEEGSQVLWFGVASVSESQFNSDYSESLPLDIDLYMRKSSDNGLTWTTIENITNSPEMVEHAMHLANIGSDTEIGVFYNVPNFNVETYAPASGILDYLNYVYVGKYENFDGSNTGGPTDPDGGSITLLSPEDYYYFPMNESNLNDTIFFQWENTYPGEIDEHEYSTVMWLGIAEPGGEILDYAWFFEGQNEFHSTDESFLMGGHLYDMLDNIGLPDSAIFIWDVLHFMGGAGGPEAASSNYYNYLIGDSDLASSVYSSNNGPFIIYSINEIAQNPYHYIYLNANVETMTLGDSLLWLDHELQVSIGDCEESIGDNWYSMDWADGTEAWVSFYTECEPGTETYYQYRIVPGDRFSNDGYEPLVSMFTDAGEDMMIYHEYIDIHPLPDNYVGITGTGGIAGDTVSVSVYVELEEEYPLNAFQITVAGLGGGDITAVGVDTAGTIMTSDWLWSYFINDSGTVVITAGAGAEPIQALGSLFNVHFVIDESSEGGFFPVFIADALFNEDEGLPFMTNTGGVEVLGIGDVSMNGGVTALDASLILQHLVGLDTLSVDQQNVGDVTDDNSLSALDAAIILDHVVGLVDELPYTPGSANLDAMMAISGGSVEPGELFQVPIELTDGTNVRSFELAFDYDIDALSVEQIVWDTEVLSGLQILDNQQEGIILVSAAGMGSSLSSGSQTLGYIEFRMDDFFDDYQTSITLSRSRVNELDAVIEGSVALYTNSTLVVSDWGDGGVPMEFALNQNYPNPFNPSTMIRYQLPEQTMVTIAIYDLMGRKVRTLVPGETQLAGYRQVVWNATNDFGQPVSAGMYIYTIQAGTYRMTKKMVLMK